jgi:hypothetical protein
LFVGLDVEQSVSQLEKSMTEGGQTVLMMDKTRDKLFFFLLSPPPPSNIFCKQTHQEGSDARTSNFVDGV